MQKALAVLAVAVALLAVCGSATAQAKDGYTTVDFKSDAMNAKAPFNVILPVGYDQSVRRYPVLLLLHGLNGHYSDWVSNTNVVLYARKYPLIIVSPRAETAGTPTASPRMTSGKTTSSRK
jgi:S-formylglutathione hydrolase FrmB